MDTGFALKRAARRPKQAKLAANAALRTYVQNQLAGAIVAPDGVALPGPAVPLKGRRHGPQQHRRWGMAWSPQQVAALAARLSERSDDSYQS